MLPCRSVLWPATTIDDGQWNGEKTGSPYLRIRRGPALPAPLFDVAPLRQLKAGPCCSPLAISATAVTGLSRAAQGGGDVAKRRGADHRHSWPRHHRRRAGDDRPAAKVGVGGGAARQRTALRQPEAFEKSAKAHPKTYQALVAILASRLRQADEALAAATFLTARRAWRSRSSSWRIGRKARPARDASCRRKSERRSRGHGRCGAEKLSRVLSEWRRRNSSSPTYPPATASTTSQRSGAKSISMFQPRPLDTPPPCSSTRPIVASGLPSWRL